MGNSSRSMPMRWCIANRGECMWRLGTGAELIRLRIELYDPASTDGKSFKVALDDVKDQIWYIFGAGTD